jgi:hypothetical protein
MPSMGEWTAQSMTFQIWIANIEIWTWTNYGSKIIIIFARFSTCSKGYKILRKNIIRIENIFLWLCREIIVMNWLYSINGIHQDNTTQKTKDWARRISQNTGATTRVLRKD